MSVQRKNQSHTSQPSFEPIVSVLACPSKTFIMRLLAKEGRIQLDQLRARPEVFELSFTRHISELLKYELAYMHDDFLIVTKEGNKVGHQVEDGLKRFREKHK